MGTILDSTKELAKRFGVENEEQTIKDQIDAITESIDQNFNGSVDIASAVSEFAKNDNPDARLGTKSITENGTYTALDDELDGYSSVTVDVAGGGGVEFSASPETFKLLTNIQNLKVDVPSGVTYIGNSAFKGCTGLTEITLPTSIVGIGDDAFNGCTGLTEITISSNMPITIDTAAFDNCTGLTEININKVTSISQYAFNGCTGLTEITLPSMINSISNTAFAGCTNLETITINKSEGSISGAPWGATNATVVWNG